MAGGLLGKGFRRHLGIMKTVVYIQHRDTDLRDYHRYGMAAMVEAGCRVVVLNMTRLIRPGYEDPRKGDGALPGVSFVRVDDRATLQDAESRYLRDARLVVMITGWTGSLGALAVYRAVSRCRCPYLVLATNAYPGFSRFREKEMAARLLDAGRRLLAGQIHPFTTLLARVSPARLGVRPADFIVHGGAGSISGATMYPVAASTRVIHAHSMDYDLYLAEKDGLAPQDRAVFIEDCIGFNIDLQLLGEEPVTAEAYYPRLRALFDRVEAELGLQVVVAANPRMNYDGNTHLFGDRPIEYGKTAALVARSRLVMGGRSTALGFAPMFRVPVMLVAMRSQYEHWVNKPAMDFFAQDLATPIRLMDGAPDALLDNALAVDTSAYERYMRTYVKRPDSPDSPFWRIVLETLTEAGVM